uniref:ParE toxin of type II toxin-antitoxin system, parDE n=1 Tax=Candidatus Kentrum sp. LFY TaxID=2126342 RepID=A0A450UD33_9GAMM|nr:MAG: ParE toxin of type II toxin-antitoxin system, parDE [Candidatus Kentron sp. LFY]
MRAVRFLLPAEVEMLEAAIFYETRVNGLGDRFLARVESAVYYVACYPQACPIVRDHIRKRLVYGFPYAVLYRIDPDEIVIVAVMHQRRRPDYWFERIADRR